VLVSSATSRTTDEYLNGNPKANCQTEGLARRPRRGFLGELCGRKLYRRQRREPPLGTPRIAVDGGVN
jgi:hypothetical protein